MTTESRGNRLRQQSIVSFQHQQWMFNQQGQPAQMWELHQLADATKTNLRGGFGVFGSHWSKTAVFHRLHPSNSWHVAGSEKVRNMSQKPVVFCPDRWIFCLRIYPRSLGSPGCIGPCRVPHCDVLCGFMLP